MLYIRYIFLFCLIDTSQADRPKQWQVWYQKAVTPVMERIDQFHIDLLWVASAILLIVSLLLLFVMFRFSEKRNKKPSKTTHNVALEVIWTIVPLVIVGIILVPSIKLIFYMDKTPDAEITVKAIGHQWYWEYEYPDYGVTFDSYILNPDQVQDSNLRNLEVDKRVVLPTNVNVRILTTSADVIHSWFVPAFGVKQDSIPGRLRETWVRINKPGVYYGQCAELCGPGHAFMPIAVHAVSKTEFIQWVRSQGGKMQNLGSN